MNGGETITEGRTITETDVVMFSYFTGDWTYLHTDKERAKNSIFGERVAHGYLTLAIALGLMIRSGAINTDLFVALRSIESVNFLKPVRIGDTLTVSYQKETETSETKPARETVKLTAKTFNQNKECVMEFVTKHLERIK